MSSQYLAPPRPGYINPEHIVPLSPPPRPPFAHYHSSTSLPATPRTPYPPPATGVPAHEAGPSGPTLTPYLTLPPRLLLTTLSPALLPLLLTIAHLISNRSSTASLASSLKASVLSACAGLAKGAASIQTMPRYLAMQTNAAAIQAGQATILGIGTALMDVVTILEVVLDFVIDTYRSMLMCTIELAVRGTLEILIGAVQSISDGVTSSLNALRTNIQNDISSANTVIQEAVSKINDVTSMVGVNITVPAFSVPALTALENVTIPTGFEDTLIKLNNSLPSLDDLRDKIESIIETPFELLKADINATRLEIAASFNASALPVPSLSSLAASEGNTNALQDELCTGLDTSLIDDTAKALHKLSNVAIGLMFLLLVLVWAALCVWEWRRWRAMKGTVGVIRDEWERNGDRDPWRVVAIVEHPMLERYGTAILHRLTPDERTRTNIRWYLAYLSHPTCLALLFIAALGFLSLQFQILALNAIKSHAQENANATVTASTNSLTAKLNDLALNQSRQYALDFNNAMAQYQQRIDDDLFGSWFNTTAVTLNSTLVEFYDGVEQALNLTFGGTILYGPINTFVYCILGSKITNFEQGLTWLQENAHVTLPTISEDALMLSNNSMNELIAPISAAAVGSGGNDNSGDTDDGIVGTLIDHFEQALVTERNFYAILLGLWLGFALVGLAVVLWHSGGRDRYLAYRARNLNDGGNATGNGVAKPNMWPWFWSKDVHPIYDDHTESEKQFRGISPTTVPCIVNTEPTDDSSMSSFFDPKRGSVDPVRRPTAERKGTFGSTLSALAAPGQAFLKMTGRARSDDGRTRLVEGGASSEKYNSTYPSPRQDQFPDEAYDARTAEHSSGRAETLATPAPVLFWVDRFYRAVETARSHFPTRGQRHGAALMRGASQRTERSFGASQVPSPGVDLAGSLGHWRGREREPSWTMVDPASIGLGLGRELDGIGDSRYPALNPSQRPNVISGGHLGHSASLSHPVYPRPMSRAPTLNDGAHRADPFQGQDISSSPLPPPLPDKNTGVRNGRLDDDHDVDFTDRAADAGGGEDGDGDDVGGGDGGDGDDDDEDGGDCLGQTMAQERMAREALASPASSSNVSYWPGQASVQSAAKVQTGTSALAAILANMQERRPQPQPQRQSPQQHQPQSQHQRQGSTGRGVGRLELDPFETPFDDTYGIESERRSEGRM